MNDLIQYLTNKYKFKEDPLNFGEKLNEHIGEFYADQKNVESFLKWLDEVSLELNVELQPMVSTFFPSLAFSVMYEVKKFDNYKVYKEDVFCISFIEEYFTSRFTTYIKESKENRKVTYKPTKLPNRDSKFELIYARIIDKISEFYPGKTYIDIKRTNAVLGEFKLTYSRNPKTTIFELMFRAKLE